VHGLRSLSRTSAHALTRQAFSHVNMRPVELICIAVIASVCAACSLAIRRRSSPEGCHYVTLSFPAGQVRTDVGERIEAVRVLVHCGRIVAINRIPDDWSASVSSPVSEETTLDMVAGHGSSMLSLSSTLDRFATVLIFESSGCFDMTASLGLYYYDGEEHERTVSFTQSELVVSDVDMDP